MKNRGKAKPANYGAIAEKRVDAALAELFEERAIHFWFRADRLLDSEGIDHVFGVVEPSFAAWVIQVTCGKKKRRTYYRVLPQQELTRLKKPYYRRRYHRYIPLLVVTQSVEARRIKMKLKAISVWSKPVFENRRCPAKVKAAVSLFLRNRGVNVPPIVS